MRLPPHLVKAMCAMMRCTSLDCVVWAWWRASSPASRNLIKTKKTEARAKTVLTTPEAWKKCRNAEDGRASTVSDATKKHAGLSLVLSKIPPELLQGGPALERDLERLWKRLLRSLDPLQA